MIRTFVDANVLIAAARAVLPESAIALRLITDSNREFVSSIFLRLEVLPKATYHRRQVEVDFYSAYFDSVVDWLQPTSYAIESALDLAKQYGLGGLDALHLTAARILNADEFITGEKPTSPIFRVQGMTIVSLFER
ncbi:MAG: PIN domain-containing protein [Bacteroidota bacterium]|nr:PIN domain-containing protein [Bacteroidota bacterium]MDP4232489.1 PIN domain-containing protein [Bacteroidota bacterium]MDP4241624.1 PIN domain-containing protein [Bacteroidota bacterium]MDP4286368.1 PIN domain-containing protein [Bacteroidota bacterium]